MNPRVVFALGRRLLGREEVDQIVRIAEWQASLTYRPGRGSSLSTYQTQAALWAVNREIERLRKATRAGESVDPGAPSHVSTDGIEVRIDLVRLLRRHPILQDRWEGRTCSDVAARLGISLKAADTRARRTVQRAAREAQKSLRATTAQR